uniref:Blastopia polyprotein n=1 Tax=Triatoma infestans TaxID=30076 RepID=A0A171AWE4_TRIIF
MVQVRSKCTKDNKLNQSRSIGFTPFELMIGTKMRGPEDIKLCELLNEEALRAYNDERSNIREKAKQQILKVQTENRRTYNRRHRQPMSYYLGDLVAVRRTQRGPGLKLRAKFLGPYKIIKVKLKDTYDVEAVGLHEGPRRTTVCAEYIKPWFPDLSLEGERKEEWPNCGNRKVPHHQEPSSGGVDRESE